MTTNNKIYYLKTNFGYIQEQYDAITTTYRIVDALRFDSIDEVYTFINVNYNRLVADIVVGLFIEEYEKVDEDKWICVDKIIV